MLPKHTKVENSFLGQWVEAQLFGIFKPILTKMLGKSIQQFCVDKAMRKYYFLFRYVHNLCNKTTNALTPQNEHVSSYIFRTNFPSTQIMVC